jgi:hypothetical protein
MMFKKTLIGVLFLTIVSFGIPLYLLAQPPTGIELLVRKYDGPGGRKAGDIVSVKGVPHKGWGRDEGLPNYVIITISDMDLEDFNQYKGRHVPVEDDKPGGELVRSKYRFDLANLPNYQVSSSAVTISEVQTAANIVDRRAEILSARVP